VSRQRQALHQEQAREGAPEASLKRVDLAAEMVGLYEWAQRVKTLSAEGAPGEIRSRSSIPKGRQGREKPPILLCCCEKYEGDAWLSRGTPRAAAIPERECPGSFAVDLDAPVC